MRRSKAFSVTHKRRVSPQKLTVADKEEAAKCALKLRQQGKSFREVAEELQAKGCPCSSYGWVRKVCLRKVVPPTAGRPLTMEPNLIGVAKAIVDFRADVGAGMSRNDLAILIGNLLQQRYNNAIAHRDDEIVQAYRKSTVIRRIISVDGHGDPKQASRRVVDSVMKAAGIKCRRRNQATAARVRAVRDWATLHTFGNFTKETYAKLSIRHARQVFDLDETNAQAVEGQMGKSTVLSSKKTPPGRCGQGSRESWTLLPIISAGGEQPYGPPLCVTKHASLKEPFEPMRPEDIPANHNQLFCGQDGNPMGCYYSTSSGHNSKVLFQHYLREHAVPWIRKHVGGHHRCAVVFMDRASTHLVSKECNDWLKSQKVHICFFPPKTTALLQPLDVVTFRDLKWYKRHLIESAPASVAAEARSISLCAGITMMSECLKHAYRDGGEHVRKSFAVAGLWPLEPKVMLRLATRVRREVGTVEEAKATILEDIVEDAQETARVVHSTHCARSLVEPAKDMKSCVAESLAAVFDTKSFMQEVEAHADKLISKKQIRDIVKSVGYRAYSMEGSLEVARLIKAKKEETAAQQREAEVQQKERAREKARKASSKLDEQTQAAKKARADAAGYRKRLRETEKENAALKRENAALKRHGAVARKVVRSETATARAANSARSAPRARTQKGQSSVSAGAGRRAAKRSRARGTGVGGTAVVDPPCDADGMVWTQPVNLTGSRAANRRRVRSRVSRG